MPTTIKRKATLASAIGALAVAAAGCGGGGGQSAVTTMGGTTTSQGGVAGAQANVGTQQLRTQANRIQQMLNRQLNRLGQVNSTKGLSQTAKSTRRQVLQAANRLDKLNLSSAKAQQLRGRISGLQSVNTKQQFTQRVDQLQAMLRQTDQAIANLNVPQSQQDSKQRLRQFIDQWQTDLKSAKQHAQQGQLQQAKQMALGLSLQDLQSLLNGLQQTTTNGS